MRPGGLVSSRGDAAIHLLTLLGAPSLAASARKAERVVERLYTLVADNRGRLGRLVPDGPAPRRFP